MAKVRAGEVEENNEDEHGGELEIQARRDERSDHRAPAFEVNVSAPWEGWQGVPCVSYRDYPSPVVGGEHCGIDDRAERSLRDQEVLAKRLLRAQLFRDRTPAGEGRGLTAASEVTRVVMERSRVHEEWIRQEGKTKRLALIIGAVLFLAGCQVVVFAPQGRETVAAIVGAAMLVVAAGTAGYRRVWGRGPLIAVGAGDAEPAAGARGELPTGTERVKRKQRRNQR